MFELSGAVASLALHIKIFGQGGNVGGRTGQLTRTPQNDLKPVVIELDGSVNFDVSVFELVNVADVAQIAVEHHHGEGTNPVVLAEIQKANATRFSNPQHFAGDTNIFADMVAGFLHGNAVGCGDSSRQQQTRHAKLHSDHHFVGSMRSASLKRLK